MPTSFNYQIVTCVEAIYLGVTPPNESDKQNRINVHFTSFINTSEKVLSPDISSEVVGDNITLKLDINTAQLIQPILKAKSLYRLILGVRDWSLNGRSGMSFRLIDINPIAPEESLFKPYLGKLKEVAIDNSQGIPSAA